MCLYVLVYNFQVKITQSYDETSFVYLIIYSKKFKMINVFEGWKGVFMLNISGKMSFTLFLNQLSLIPFCIHQFRTFTRFSRNGLI